MKTPLPDGIDMRPSRRFRHSYLVALTLIALITGVSQYYVHRTLADQEADGLIINLSGRQRYTSQRIVKCMFILAHTKGAATFRRREVELKEAVETWRRSHNAFLYGDEGLHIHNRNNTAEIQELFAEIQPHFDTVVACAEGFMAVSTPPVPGQVRDTAQQARMQGYLDEVIQHELPFLMGMDAIVKAYADVSRQKVIRLAQVEEVLAGIMVVTLLLEALLIFRPAIRAMTAQLGRSATYANETRTAHAELQARHEELTWKNAYIEKLMASTTQSISYAQRIQHSLMPSEGQLRQSLPHLFLYYKPRDIVSGDFYWFKEQGDTIFLAVADCTGHGIPGCLMSVLGINLLSDVVDKFPDAEPHRILEELDRRLTSQLVAGTEHEVVDGMDIALCRISRSAQTLAFASAKQPMMLVRGGELHTYKGSRRSLGNPLMRDIPILTQHIALEPDDVLYLYSDGVTDQFSADNRRYGTPRLREFLLTSADQPLHRQQAGLHAELKSWQQDANQTDDMVLIGLRFQEAA